MKFKIGEKALFKSYFKTMQCLIIEVHDKYYMVWPNKANYNECAYEHQLSKYKNQWYEESI